MGFLTERFAVLQRKLADLDVQYTGLLEETRRRRAEKGFWGNLNPHAARCSFLCAQSAYLAGANPTHHQTLYFVLFK